MFRYILNLLVRLWRAICHALAEFWALLCQPFRGMGPGAIRAKLASDRADLSASSQFIVLETSRTARGIFSVIARAPFDFLRWLIAAPGRLWRYLRSRTYKQLFMLGTFATLFVTAVTVPPSIVLHNRKLNRIMQRYQQQLETDFVLCNLEGVQSDLEALLEVRPNDSVIQARLRALEIGSADSQDPKMARLLMANHRGRGKLDEAHREAQKHVLFAPKDWTTLIILAEHALAKGNRAAALQWVSRLPPTSEASGLSSMWACATSANIFQELGDEPRLDDLTEYITKHVVPYLSKPLAASSEPAFQVQLIEMYVIAMRQLARQPDLLDYWDDAQNLTDKVLEAKQPSLGSLINLGIKLEMLREVHLREIEQLKLVSPAKSADMAKQLEERLSAVWSRVRSDDPKNAFGYVGPASQLSRAGDVPGALAQVENGIQVAGQIPELFEKKAELLRVLKPAEAVQFLDSVLGGPPKTPGQCRLLALAALACGQTDRARDAVRRGQAMLPNAPWLNVLEAEVDLQAGRPTDATIALRKVQHLIPRDVNASRLYVRAQCACGAVVLAEQFLNDLIDNHPGSTPAVIMGCNSLVQSGQLGTAVNVLRRLNHREPLNLAAAIALAESLFIQAEYRPKGWTQNELDEALAAYRQGLRKHPDQLEFVNRITWLELIALDSPRQAYATSAPLRTAKDLSPDALRTVGAVYAYSGEYENARANLEKSLERTGPQAGTLSLLALAQHGLNKSAEAKETLDRAKAAENPTPREVELRDTIEKKIQRGRRS